MLIRSGKPRIIAIDRLESRILFTALTFSPAPLNLTNDAPGQMVVGDFSNNGILDIAEPDELSNTVSVFMGNGDGTFQADNYFTVGSRPDALAGGDLRDNGIEDLVVANSADNDVEVLLGNGNGTFQSGVTYPVGNDPVAVQIADVTGNGIPDIIALNANDENISILLGNGNGTFQPAENIGIGGTAPDAMAIGDLNGQGRADIVTCNAGSTNVSVLMNLGNGNFAAPVTYPLVAFADPDDIALANLGNNGILDIVVADHGVGINQVSVLLGNGNGTFQAATNYAVGDEPETLGIGDFSNDGNLDILTGSDIDLTVNILEGNGNGTFQPAQTFSAPNDPIKMAVGDFNNDGKLDYAYAGDIYVSVYLNTTALPQTLPAPTGIAASNGAYPHHVQLTWNAVAGAASYQVFRSVTDNFASAIKIGPGITTTTFDDNTAIPGMEYYYWVRARNSSGIGLSGGSVTGFTEMAAPTDVATSGLTHHVAIAWAAVTGAATYQVFRSTTDNFSTATRIANGITTLYYNDTTAASSVLYYYFVRAKSPLGVGIFSAGVQGGLG
ncbi:MAG: VCBS repeat-containing protein [Tepidisphaeraceae bacterium]|jgi:hypothetical protein